MNKFAERLKELRQELGLTQAQLGEKVSINPSCITRWELKQRTPNIESIIVLCKFFKVSSDYLIGLED